MLLRRRNCAAAGHRRNAGCPSGWQPWERAGSYFAPHSPSSPKRCTWLGMSRCSSCASLRRRLASSYGAAEDKGFCHLYIGQEACVAGAVSALQKGDKYITAYRDHAHPLALGTSPMPSWPSCLPRLPAARKARVARCTCLTRKLGLWGPRHCGRPDSDGRGHCLC